MVKLRLNFREELLMIVKRDELLLNLWCKLIVIKKSRALMIVRKVIEKWIDNNKRWKKKIK